MSEPTGSEPNGVPPAERWSVNLPAVVGVVFVLLVAVIVWVVASGGDDPDPDPATGSAVAGGLPATTLGGAPAPSAPPQTTSPPPLPTTTVATSTTSTTVATSTTSTTSTTAPPSTAPATTAPGAGPGAVPGDLGIDGHPMVRPPCNGAAITVLASAVGDDASAAGIGALLDRYRGASYLRTDRSCRSLAQELDGEPIYVVFLGPFAFESDACTARADGPAGAYARLLSDDVGPDHTVDCS